MSATMEDHKQAVAEGAPDGRPNVLAGFAAVALLVLGLAARSNLIVGFLVLLCVFTPWRSSSQSGRTKCSGAASAPTWFTSP